jgi:hypothetical protein
VLLPDEWWAVRAALLAFQLPTVYNPSTGQTNKQKIEMKNCQTILFSPALFW